MKNNLYKSLLLFGIIIPTFLFSACSEKSEHIHISSKSKVWLGVQVKDIPERRLEKPAPLPGRTSLAHHQPNRRKSDAPAPLSGA